MHTHRKEPFKMIPRVSSMTLAALIACCGLSISALAQDVKPAAPKSDAPKTDAPAAADKPAQQPASPSKPKDYVGKRLIVGDAAPALSVEKWLKGEPVTGFEKDKVYVVEFWATWCGPCKAAMPHVTELQKQYKGKVTFIGIGSPGWRDTLSQAEDMVKEKGDEMGYTVAWDKSIATDEKDNNDKPVVLGATNEAYMKAARQTGIPRAFVIDGKGNLAWLGHPMELDYVLDEIVAGKWDYKESPIKIQEMKNEAAKIFEDMDGNQKEALKQIGAFEEKYPKMAPRLAGPKYELLFNLKNYTEAYKVGEKVVDEAIAHKDQMSLNRIAWNIVDPEGPVGKADRQAGLPLAMRAAKAAVEITKEKDAAILDTLARCYWVKGDKPKAVELQKKAVAALTKDDPEETKDQLQTTLKEYEGGAN
jgi:thiol-disulfide isomerase/thioredoxin